MKESRDRVSVDLDEVSTRLGTLEGVGEVLKGAVSSLTELDDVPEQSERKLAEVDSLADRDLSAFLDELVATMVEAASVSLRAVDEMAGYCTGLRKVDHEVAACVHAALPREGEDRGR